MDRRSSHVEERTADDFRQHAPGGTEHRTTCPTKSSIASPVESPERVIETYDNEIVPALAPVAAR